MRFQTNLVDSINIFKIEQPPADYIRIMQIQLESFRFQQHHTDFIKQIIANNDKSDSIDFNVKVNQYGRFNLDDIRDPNVKYPNQKKNGKIRVNPLGKNPTDVWEFPKVTSGQNRSSKERTPHPAQFPSAVIQRIIQASSHQNQIVLDPFLGSGTTAMVALDLNRLVIGFEIREDYCDIAANRIETFLSDKKGRVEQMSLFLENSF